MGEIFGVRCRKRVWVYSERVFGLFRGEETLPRKGVACSMERVRGGRIGSLRPVSERALAGRGSPALVSGAACGAGRQLPLYNYDSGCFIFDTMLKAVSIPFRSRM